VTQIGSPLALGSAAAPGSTQSNLMGSVSTDTARLGTRDNLQQAGERFEAIFTKMMLGSMRKAKLADGLFESQALDQFRDMQDDRLAQSMASGAPLGIGKAMTEFLAKSGSVTQAAPAVAPAGESR